MEKFLKIHIKNIRHSLPPYYFPGNFRKFSEHMYYWPIYFHCPHLILCGNIVCFEKERKHLENVG